MATVVHPDDIRHELAVLTNRVDALEQRLGRPNNGLLEGLEQSHIMNEVREITQEIFPGKFAVEIERDPEYPDDRYVVISVEATGTPKDIVDRSCQWDERVQRSWPHLWDTLRLMVVPR